MEANSWPKSEPQSMDGGGISAPGAVSDWRSQLQREARQRIINKIMETLKKHLPINVPDGMSELLKIAVRFEDKIYTAAKDQSDYLRRISLKMLSMETKTQNSTGINPSISTTAVGSQNTMESAASLRVQPQLGSQGQQLSMPVISQTPVRQPVFSQNLQNNNGPANMQSSSLQGSAGMQTSLSTMSGLPQSTVANVDQPSNSQNMPGVSINTIGHSSGQAAAPNIYANSQRQLQGRQQQQTVMSQQHQHQPQNPMMYHPAIQQQMIKQKMQQLHPHLQQQQAMLHSNQLQSLKQQPQVQMSSTMQSGQATLQQTQPSATAPQTSLQQQSHQNSIPQSVPSQLQQHTQTTVRQHQVQPTIQHSSPLQQQSAGISQQPLLASQQQQLMGQQSNMLGMQADQLVGQQNNADQQLQQPRIGQQNNLLGVQQPQQNLNQSLSLHQQQQLGSQGNISGLQQQQLLGTQPNLRNVQQPCPMNILQQTKTASQQQNHQQSTTMLQTQSQQIPHVKSQPTHLQQQMPVQQQPNPLQREIQQRLQASGGFQSQNAIEQQKQFIPSQRALPEVTSSTSLDSTAQTGNLSAAEWQEEAYRKIKSLKEAYLQELVDFNQKISMKMQQQEALGQVAKQSEQYKRLENYKVAVGRMIQFLQMPKSSIHPGLSDKIESFEKQILQFVNTRGRRVAQQPQMQQQFQQGANGLPMTQQQPSQAAQKQHDKHANQAQALSLQGAGASLHPAPTSMQHGSMHISQLGIQTSHQNMGNLMQPSVTIDLAQGNSLGSLQQGAISSVQHSRIGSVQNAMNTSQQNSMNSLPQSSVSMLQPNVSSLQTGGNVLQQHLKQEQQQQPQQHLMQSQQMKQQLHQRHLQQQFMQQQQKHQLPHQQPAHQQQLLQQKQQQATQLTQLNQNEVNEMKLRQGNAVKPGLYQQHYAAARHNYYNQQLKTGLPISSPQNLQASSPQISQHSSPQIDQHGLLSSQTKAGTPMQTSNSPLVVPSPSTPVAPSPMPGDAEKQHSAVSALTNAPTMGHQQSNLGVHQNQSLAVGTPGISASPLLAECTSLDGNQANTSAVSTGKSTATERPLDRLVKAVQSLSPAALNSSMRDIGSVVSMIDRIAGSAPGNGSRAAVGEDLTAMTKCRLQARSFISQDVGVTTKKMKRHTSAMPLNAVASLCSVNDNFKQLCDFNTSELESTASSSTKRRKAEVRIYYSKSHSSGRDTEINQQLIETIVSVSDEDVDSVALAAGCGDGMVVKFSFIAVACSSRLKSQFLPSQMSPIMPPRLFVPANYPKCSPILLDKLPTDVSLEHEDLASKAKSRFSISLRGLSQPMSLGDMAKTWDVCARTVIAEYAQQLGGGSFSSRYGIWENCVSA